jgi:hypothetical protein
MAAPPKDADGYVEPHDDPREIPDDSYVVRRISREWLKPAAGNRRELSKGAFAPSSKSHDRYQGMSVDILDRLNDDGVNPASRLKSNQEAAVIIRVGDLRQLGLKIGPDPTQNNDKYHASVWGVKGTHRKRIKALSDWLFRPVDVD